MKMRIAAPALVFVLGLLLHADESRCDLSEGSFQTDAAGKRVPISSNEALALLTLRHLAEVEYTLQSTIGRAKDFGTLQELVAARLIDAELAGGTKWGYAYSSTEAPSFEVRTIPLQYGVTGKWSFYVDETYVLRGDDKGGAEANYNDPEYSRIK